MVDSVILPTEVLSLRMAQVHHDQDDNPLPPTRHGLKPVFHRMD